MENMDMQSDEKNLSEAQSNVKAKDQQDVRKSWEPMKLTYSGEAKDIVRSGGGKTSVTLADQGDTNKPKGQG
jgi:hypothetical protein